MKWLGWLVGLIYTLSIFAAIKGDPGWAPYLAPFLAGLCGSWIGMKAFGAKQ